jgi:hypothetical protein
MRLPFLRAVPEMQAIHIVEGDLSISDISLYVRLGIGTRTREWRPDGKNEY